MTFFSVNYK